MNYKKDFDVFVGGKSGVFKGVKIDKKTCIVKNIKSLMSITEDDEVTAMSWGDEEEKDILLACGSKGKRSVKIYDTEHSAFSSSFTCDSGEGNIVGLTRYNDAVITAVESGHVNLWRFNEENESLIEAGKNLSRMRHSTVDRNIIATGGKAHPLQLFDLEKRTKVFTEKNVKHDWLELEVPVWVSDIGFFPNSKQVATCSKYGHVRLYDPAAQRRPVINLEVKDQALITLAVSPRERHIVVGSGKGVMNLIDLRKPGKILNTYKDFVGSITSVACTKSNPYIVSVGLDRYLRVHHLDTKQLLKKVYMTSRLSSMVLRSDFMLHDDNGVKDESKEGVRGDDDEGIHVTDVESESEAEYDEMFDKMAVIANEENEANIIEKKLKRGKTDKTKRKNQETTEESTPSSSKRKKKKSKE